MRKKIVFIGAGSFTFTRKLLVDILSYPALSDSEIVLYDIDEEKLGYSTSAAEKIITAGNYGAKLTPTLNRAEAIEGADGIVITILSGSTDDWKNDLEIPKSFGVDINVGDTRGPAGVFRFLRTAPALLEICRDIEKYAPNALVLNYTNPMAMLCLCMRKMTRVNITGLCHSVQKTAALLASWLGEDMKDVKYTCAGINHMAFYLDYTVGGEDAYPCLRELMKVPEIYNNEIVRNEMFLHLGYYPTESSGHNSEYNPWFRKRPDLIEKYCTHGTNWNPGVYASVYKGYAARVNVWREGIKDWLEQPEIDLSRGGEYAACIFNAKFGDNEPFYFNANVPNDQYLDDLPHGCCVEVPALADKDGIRAFRVGALPPQLAVLINISARCESLAVDGFIEKDRRKIYYSILYDPLTSAVLSMEETTKMVDKMFIANERYIDF